MPLSNCLAKAGNKILQRDRTAIQELIDSGMSEEQAIDAHIADLESQIEEVTTQAEDQGVEFPDDEIEIIGMNEGVQEQKNTVKKTVRSLLQSGQITGDHAFRGTTLAELKKIASTGQLQVGRDAEGVPGISAAIVNDGQFPVYGDGFGYIVPPETVSPSGRAGEVLVDEKIDPKNLQYIVGDKVLSFDELKSQDAAQVLFQSEPNAMGLYSGLQRFVEDMKIPQWKTEDKPASGNDIWAKINKAPLKKEELKWTGIEEFLTAQPKAKFTRQQVVDFIEQNGVNIEEVVATEDGGDMGGDDIDWNEPEVWDDPEAWEHDVEDMLYDFDAGASDTVHVDADDWMEQWAHQNIETVRDNYLHSLPDDQQEELSALDDPYQILNYIQEKVDSADYTQDLRQEARDDFEENANLTAEQAYRENPIYIQKSSNVDDLIIVGNDDQGYDIRTSMDYIIAVARDIWSVAEAEVQAREYAYEEGLIGDESDPERAQWGEHIMEGDSDNYREIKLTLPEIEGDFYNATHFPDRNILAFLRVDDRDLLPKTSPRIEEQQVELDVEIVGGNEGPHIIRIFRKDDDETVRSLRADLSRYDDPAQALQTVKSNMNKPNMKFGSGYGTDEFGNTVQFAGGGQPVTSNTYFVDEFQSDWASEGRKSGFKTGEKTSTELEDRAKDIFYEMKSELDDYFIENKIPYELNATAVNEYLNPGKSGFSQENVDQVQDFITDPEFVEIMTRREKLNTEYKKLKKAAETERNGEPPAPFVMNDNWLSLGLKRAIVDAVKGGYDSFAWPNAAVLEDRWSSSYDYTSQYDKKMPSIVKKLTGQKPQHLDMAGEDMGKEDNHVFVENSESKEALEEKYRGDVTVMSGVEDGSVKPVQLPNGEWNLLDTGKATEQGYHIIEITDELRDQVKDEGFSMFQKERGSITLLEDERVIRLSESSDLSTFLHEASHLFLEMEKVFAAEYGITEDQQTILDYLGAKSFDEITATTEAGVEMHEKFARSFEAWLREGKAPSLKLRDAFSAFTRWLKRIYQNIAQLNVPLNDEVRDVFARMLATEAEMQEVMANPAYDQFFRSKEQAGMSDQEWKEYQERVAKAKNRVEGDINEKLIKEVRKRRSAEWDEEKQPLIDEWTEILSKEPVYKVLSDITIDPMDYDLVKEIHGSIPGKMIGKAKKDGIEPAMYADTHGFPSAKQMLKEIDSVPTLKAAAEAQAQEQMISIHGDILNDGTIEEEIRESIHNDAQAAVALAEVRALGRQSRRPDINREYLKYESKRIIDQMKYKEIQPGRYYRNEIKAAEKAKVAESPLEQWQYKVQQLTNHYLYKAAIDAKKTMETQRRYVRGVQNRTYSVRNVRQDYITNLKAVAHMYDMREKPEQVRTVTSVINWYLGQAEAGELVLRTELMDFNLIKALEAHKNNEPYTAEKLPTFDDLTAEELEGLYLQLRHLRHMGGKLSDEAAVEFQQQADRFTDSIHENGGEDHRTHSHRGQKEDYQETKKDWSHFWNKLNSLRNLSRTLDGDWKKSGGNGVAHELIYMETERANENKVRMHREMYEKFKELMSDVHNVSLDRSDKNSTTIVKQDGGSWTVNSEARFMLAAYWGTESSRDAVRQGFGVTDVDVMNVLNTMSEKELNLVNNLWQLNESMWPELSAASVKVYGVAPPKLDALPFSVNGVTMKGGHMRLIYDSSEIDMKNQSEEQAMFSSILPTKAGSLHARVGSGGRPPLLSVDNITRAISDNIHFSAFAEPSLKIAGIVNNKKVKAAMERKHGEAFRLALIETLDGITSTRKELSTARWFNRLARITRQAATFRVLAYSIRNIVQQVSAIPVAAHEVGYKNLLSGYVDFVSNYEGEKAVDFINERSQFMRDRASTVNREAAEYLKQMKVTNKVGAAWEGFKDYGFFGQTVVDKLIAYPTWMAKYKSEMDLHGNENLAVSNANTAVKESVGSGSNLDLPGLYQSNQTEWVRTMTMFGSWFISYYQRVYRATEGHTKFASVEAFNTIFTTPFIVATLSALIIMDGPGEDATEEDIFLWMLKNWGEFTLAMIPLVRDVAGTFSGFTPKTTTAGALEAPVKLVREFQAYGDDRQSGTKMTSDALKLVSTVLPMPGVGNVTRELDYIDSYQQGNEGDFNALGAYQSIVEGSNKNEPN